MFVGVTGHQDIPAEALPFIKQNLQRVLSEHRDALVGITSLAAGADQLFAETVLSIQGQLHVVLPSDRYEETFSTDAALVNFKNLLGKASVVETLPFPAPSEDAFLEAGCKVVSLSDLLVAVWDGGQARGEGGTADIVRLAENQQKQICVIWPAGIHRK